MVTSLTSRWSALRRAFSRGEWSAKLLGLPKQTTSTSDDGLILIQVDGLSRVQFEAALAHGRLPFLRSLQRRERYQLHSFYSGLPSSTPSVQGELFYGQHCAVPGFAFRDHKTGQSVQMLVPTVAETVQSQLAEANEGLLEGGSAYCDMYDGGAAEAHFCASGLGWSQLWQMVHPLKLAVVLLWYGGSFLRAIGLTIAEFFLALVAFFRRGMGGREVWQELLMIPSRVIVAVLLRELTMIGASIDASRGLPIIHLNLLGYDEHAHRAGPESKFAHWTLRGIDRAIRRLTRAAHHSSRRHYEIWIYSDHGQETATPYELRMGKTLHAACTEAIEAVCGTQMIDPDPHREPRLPSRAQWLSAKRWVQLLWGEPVQREASPSQGLELSASGPLAHLYPGQMLSPRQRHTLAERLVREHAVPLVLIASGEREVTAVTLDGTFQLPGQATAVFGDEHPFRREVARDLVDLCHHPDAGSLVLSGWKRDGTQLSFSFHHGVHAGPGPEETHGFALLPFNAPVPHGEKYLRPSAMRAAVQRFRGHATPVRAMVRPRNTELTTIRVMTYNVHGCVGMDGRLSPARIARVIAQANVDVVALQEIDVRRKRSRFTDQAHEIARHLEMEHQFQPAWTIEEEQYGNAILSRLPFRMVKTGTLPATKSKRTARIVMWSEIAIDSRTTLQFLNTHLSIYPVERRRQATALVDEGWIEQATEQGPTILCGDFNANPNSPAHRTVTRWLTDAHAAAAGRTGPTWFSPRPLTRIDHIFSSAGIQIRAAEVIRSRLASVASDHLPLVVECVVAPEVGREVPEIPPVGTMEGPRV